jgi:hypothetical protein
MPKGTITGKLSQYNYINIHVLASMLACKLNVINT